MHLTKKYDITLPLITTKEFIVQEKSFVLENVIHIKAPHSRLSDVMKDLPDNVYLNKTTCGCGATYLCLTNDVNYVVLVPYLSLIENKQNDLKHIFAVSGGITKDGIKKYIEGDAKVKKIISTYDSFYKVLDVLEELSLTSEFKLCFDEAHSLISLSKIKGAVFNHFYKNFRKFKSFVFVTATPNDSDLLPSQLSDVPFTRVSWENTTLVDIKEKHADSVADCNKLVMEVCKQHLLGEINGNAYIFYNSVQEIITIIKKLKKMQGFCEDNVNIFCAKTDRNNHKVSTQLGKRFLGGKLNDNKKINFLTSTTYEGCDINDRVGRTYIVVSSKRNSTALTNHILVPQICGRLRKSVYKKEAVMFVCGFDQDIYSKGKQYFLDKLSEMRKEAEYNINRAIQAKEDGYDDVFMEDMERFATSSFIIEDENGMPVLNDDAIKLEEQVYRAFNQHCVTVKSGIEVANTVRTVDNSMFNMSDITKLLIDKKVDYSRLMKQYLTALEIGDKDTIQTIANFSEEHKLHVDVLGIDKIRAIGLNKTKITQAYNLKLRFNSLTVQIKNNLSGVYIGSRYSLSQITQILHEAYKNVDYSKNVKSTDIKNYFNVQDVWMTIDGKRCKGYLILEDLYKEIEYED